MGGIVPSRYTGKTIWEVLHDNQDDDWMIYHQHLYPNIVPPWFYSYTRDAFKVPHPMKHFHHIEKFFELVDNGKKLPSFSYLEPDWVGILNLEGSEVGMPNSYHPPAEVGPGEKFLKRLFDALSRSECWDQTLLIISFDEHGGTYDHVCPGPATPPQSDTPVGQCGFRFDRFGVRVSTILVSPRIEKQTIFRSLTDIPYDHTSTIATILKWKGIEPANAGMGNRVAKAPTFENVITRETPRDDTPELEVAEAFSKDPHPDEVPPSDLQGFVLPRMLQQLSDGKLSADAAEAIAEEIMLKSATLGDVHRELADVVRGMLADQSR
jgi:phospholipase C